MEQERREFSTPGHPPPPTQGREMGSGQEVSKRGERGRKAPVQMSAKRGRPVHRTGDLPPAAWVK